MWRYKVIELPRVESKERDDTLWELGRAGWELVQVLEGAENDSTDRTKVTLFFKRTASEDIGV